MCLISARASHVSNLRMAFPVPRPDTNPPASAKFEPVQDVEPGTESFGAGFAPQNDVKCAIVMMVRPPIFQLPRASIRLSYSLTNGRPSRNILTAAVSVALIS
ncbi:hypothetical protein Tcan_00157 [Toxocara canis]|uniref:Uncharacterized protein n=1 Tax=Toxocara canis TaxID=6265 RepID=A0A0B2VK68_TOXCA|nr:hypothetical protein Tcan_00157 [Toxocara canis]